MNLISIVVFAGILVLLGQGIFAVMIWWRRKHLSYLLQVERTQRSFAEVRNNLVSMALKKEIGADSETFNFIYFLTTLFMRRPDQYGSLSMLIAHVSLQKAKVVEDSELIKESKSWSPEIKAVFKASADAMGNIVFDYSQLFRLLLWLERRKEPSLTPHQVLNRLSVQNAEAERRKLDQEVKQTQSEMYRMCSV